MHQTPVWRPDVTVAALVERDGAFLFVAERVRGELVLNQPAGHLEQHETLIEATIREAREETRWTIRPTALLGAYQWQSPEPGLGFLRFTFVADAIAEDLSLSLDQGIEQVLWLRRDELLQCGIKHRSPLVLANVDDYVRGQRHGLDLCRWVVTP
ncbi:NUDIX hydrolase [Ahniella affigens]|uniref:NUDIX hydrolase n=1 Tax=Ahniella affigens TaxID=2021234 RepID=A0A2P1PS47_9GAMM|nr:NUDIX hydrolase [Ahniella affigens]AVP97650.1 NUDIX hydrolase [Ahniella affigens]